MYFYKVYFFLLICVGIPVHPWSVACATGSSYCHLLAMERSGTKLLGSYINNTTSASTSVYTGSFLFQMEVCNMN